VVKLLCFHDLEPFPGKEFRLSVLHLVTGHPQPASDLLPSIADSLRTSTTGVEPSAGVRLYYTTSSSSPSIKTVQVVLLQILNPSVPNLKSQTLRVTLFSQPAVTLTWHLLVGDTLHKTRPPP
jgi:hypothetical protein